MPAEKTLTLIIGGARSGKSSLAERLASGSGRVLFVATAQVGDGEMADRIAVHRAARPDAWDTLEEPIQIADALRGALGDAPVDRRERYDTVVIDCLTLWVSNLMLSDDTKAPEYDIETSKLLRTYEDGCATWIVVTNEVGLGVVPPSASGRAFRDALGRVNAAFAQRADRVLSMTAGLALELRSAGARHWSEMNP